MAKKSIPSARSKSFDLEVFGRTITFTKGAYKLPTYATAAFKGTCDGVAFILFAYTKELRGIRWGSDKLRTREKPAWVSAVMNEDGVSYSAYGSSGEQPTPEKAVEKAREGVISGSVRIVENLTKSRDEALRKLVLCENALMSIRTKNNRLISMKVESGKTRR